MTQQPHPAAVVELAAFEHQKENIQPLRSGRSAAALAERFATATTTTTTTGHKAVSARESHYAGNRPKDPAMDPTATTHTDTAVATAVATAEQLETRREAMERALDAVSDDSDDDPLDPFHRYIRWVEQYFSQDHVSYMRVLETAIRRFRKDIRYKNDPRHLMLWMRLAKRSPTPVDIFKYLSVNEIGQQTALYYEEYAGLMETCSKLDEAHEILLLGIHRNAQPLDRLVRSKTEFLARRSSATIAALSDTMESSVDPLLSGDMLDSDLESRPPLRHVDRYSIQDNSAAAHSIQPQTHQIQSNPYPLSSQSSHASSSIVRGRQSQTKMRVFSDNAVDGGDGTDALRDRAMPTASFSNPWPVYDGEVQRRKENMPEATKWSGSTLPQKHSHLPPTAGMAKIPVYQDEAVRVPSTKATAMQLKEAHGILQDVNLTSKPMALLQSLSLEQPTEISISSKVPQNGQAKPIVSLSSHIPPSQPSAKESVCIWRKEMFFVGGLELCLEEYRATMPRYAVDAVAHTNPNSSSVMDTSISSDMNLGDRSSDTHMASSFSLPPPAPERTSSGPISNSLHYPTGSAIHAGVSSTPPRFQKVSRGVPKSKEVASPTINTKAAMADIFEMFTVPLAAEDPKHVQPFGNVHDWADDEDETISSKVYRPASASQKIGVFRDNNDNDESGHFSTSGLGVSRDDPANMDRSRLSSMSPVSRPLGQDKHLSKAASTSFRIHHDENAENRSSGYNGGDVRRGEIIKESSSDRDTFQRSSIPAGSDFNSNDSVEIRPAAGRPLPMHSTPYNYTRTGDIIQSESEASQGSLSTVSRARLILGQTLDPMTPITEASSDLDRTMGGLSTIRSCATTSGISTITEEVDDTMACRRRPLGSYRSVSSTESLGDTRRILSSCDDDDDNNHENYSGFTVQSDAEYHHNNPVADMHHQADQLQRLYLSNEDGDDHVDRHRDPIEMEGGHDTMDAGLHILDVPNPCDPYDKDIRQAILTQIAPLLMQETQPCYDHSDTVVDLPQNKVRGKYNDLHLDSVGTLNILGRIGEGGFGQVLLVQRELEQLGHVLNEADLADLLNDSFDGEDEMQDEGDANHVTLSEQIYALKIESPPSRWEHHMLCILASRLSPDVLESIIGCHSLHVYDNASMLLLPHCKYGSVIDCLNGASMRSYGVDGAGVNEALVAFWTIEMLRIVSALHSNGIVHGDIKADNLMLRFEVNSSGHSTSKPRSTNLQAQYQSDGSSGWDSKGLVMIDWGNSIDLRVFPSDHTFVTEVKERRAMGRGQGRAAQLDESIECFEVRKGAPWRFQPDWYGVASVVHLLLFRLDMQVVASTVDAADPTADSVLSEFPILHLKRPFKRNWQTAIWTRLFDVLLNSGRYGAGKSSDCLTEINAIRTDLEEWLHTVSVRGSTMLRGLLSSVQASAMEKRRLPAR